MTNFEAYDPLTTPQTRRPVEVKSKKKGRKLHKLKFILDILTIISMIAGVLYLFFIFELPTEMPSDINESFNAGTAYGIEYTINRITQEAIQCKPIPMNYSGYEYTLIAYECLNLTGAK